MIRIYTRGKRNGVLTENGEIGALEGKYRACGELNGRRIDTGWLEKSALEYLLKLRGAPTPTPRTVVAVGPFRATLDTNPGSR